MLPSVAGLGMVRGARHSGAQGLARFESASAIGFDVLENQLRASDVHAVTDPQSTLVDAFPVDVGPGIVAEIDEGYLRRARHLDDRVHARRCRIVDPQMTLGITPHFDNVVRDRITADELTPLIGGERYDSLCHTLEFLTATATDLGRTRRGLSVKDISRHAACMQRDTRGTKTYGARKALGK